MPRRFITGFNSEDCYIDVSGGQLFVRRWIPKNVLDQPAIILIHDSLGCVQMWRDFAEYLAQTLAREVIAYDRLGFGQSSGVSQQPNFNFIEHEAKVIFPQLCQALKLQKVMVFGHSVGGVMALTIASNNASKSLCQAVISESAQAYVQKRTLTGILAAKEYFSNAQAFAKLVKYHGDKAQWVLAAWTDIWLDPAFACWSLEALEAVQCPVLVIHGDQDEYGTTDFAHRIAQGVSGFSQTVILENVKHVPHRQCPQQLMASISSFLAGIKN
jgi:pimeloyl-ACP methyl ester carboxylesterase